MVDQADRAGLRHRLDQAQYASHDSTPALLSRPVPASSAAQVLAVCGVLSLALLLLIDRVPTINAVFPDGDFYFSRYPGEYVLPLRLFMLSFYVAYASAILAPWPARVRFAFELMLPYMLFCVTMDMCNAIVGTLGGVQLPAQAISIVAALMGFLFFSLSVLSYADMPQTDDGPMRGRFKLRSLVIVLAAIIGSALISVWALQYELYLVNRLRDMSLLGGISVGLFLFVPLIFFLLNVLAACQNLFRRLRHFAPDITIIIPAHNEGHGIATCIAAADAAAANYSGSVSLIVVNSASTDNTAEVAAKALADCRHCGGELLNEPEPGKARALNLALAAVQTNHFARLDADTLLKPDTLRLAFRHFQHPYVGCVGGMPLPPGGGPFDGARLVEVLLRAGYDQVALGAADTIIGIPGMFACYRTDAVREAGGFCADINGEDSDVALRIGEAGYRLIVDADVPFTSEVPRSFAHMREERLRWYRSIYHVVARNRRLLLITTPSVRGRIVLPFLLMNSGRRAMGWPLLLFAINFLLLAPDPESSLRVSSLLAILMGAPLLNAVIAILVNLRPWDLLQLPAYIGFRMLRYYFTLEALLSMTYDRFAGMRGDQPVQSEIAILHHEDRPLIDKADEVQLPLAAATVTRLR